MLLLHLPHLRIPSSTSFQQSAMTPLLGHPPLVQHHDLVGVLNGAQPERRKGKRGGERERCK